MKSLSHVTVIAGRRLHQNRILDTTHVPRERQRQQFGTLGRAALGE